MAKGQGPVGLWPVSERYALVADTSIPGLLLVDLQTGIAKERLVTPMVRPVGVATCPNCRFALLSSNKSDHWLLHFEDTVSNLLETKGRLGLSSARIERFPIHTAGGKLMDGRMCLVSTDAQTAFVASSYDHLVARVDLSRPSNAVTLFSDKKAKPYGLNWGRNGDLLVTMHKNEIRRITTQGKLLANYDIRTAACPGVHELNPNLRAALDDPLNEGSLLVLASNPKSYDAVVWRLSIDAQGKQSCVNVAGKIGRESGWIDATGEAIEFSRPHYFVQRPDSQPPQLILSDIDNRTLRLLDISTYTTSSLMYYTDRLMNDDARPEQLSSVSCAQLNWPITSFLDASGEFQFCRKPAAGKTLRLTDAQAQCTADGARLCTPAELMSVSGVPAGTTWTSAECASCWQRKAGERCGIGPDHKTSNMVHADKAFSQRWHSGQALVVTASDSLPALTVCRPVLDADRAVAACCADVFPVSAPGVSDAGDG
ncbi:MAG: hypothetical protein R3E64_11055 [Halioglobus sp.]